MKKALVTGANGFVGSALVRELLKENIEDLIRDEDKYWFDYANISDDKKIEIETKLKQKIFLIQNTIMDLGFNSKVEKIDSLEEGIEFLNKLKEFGLNRIRIAEIKSDGNKEFKDPEFKEYFQKVKKSLEEKFGSMDIEYDDNEWKIKNPLQKMTCEVTDEEKDEIFILSSIFRKNNKRQGKLAKLFKKLLDTPNDNKLMKSQNNFYKIDLTNNSDSNMYKENDNKDKKNKIDIERMD